MINNSENSRLSELLNQYQEAFRDFDNSKPPPAIEIRFYPYVNVNHTIRIRSGKVFVRISDLFEKVPIEIHRALAHILVAKLLGKKVPDNARRSYRQFVNDEDFQKAALENKRRKGRKVFTSTNGNYFDLEQVFGKLNLIYFQNRIEKPALSWSQKRTYRRLGHFDSAHNSISISRSLDDKSVPKFVIEFVLYHEMLHIKHPTKHRNGRRYNHTPAFKLDEKKFAYYYEAEEWIEKNAAKLKRMANRR